MTFRCIPCLPMSAIAITASDVSTAADPAAYNPATSYGVDTDAVPVRVLDPATNLIYRSRVASNVGHDPATSETQWQEVGYSVRWRMFDNRVGSGTSDASAWFQSFTLGTAIDTASMIVGGASSVRYQMVDPVDGAVYDQTRDLVSTDGIDNHYDYWFQPVVLANKVIFGDLPAYPNAVHTVTFTGAGGTPTCYLCKFGMAIRAGEVEWGMSMGITDFSLKNPNEFGDNPLLERDYTENLTLTAWVPRGRSGQLFRALTDQRAKGCIYIGDDTQPDSLAYGFPDDWQRVWRTLEFDVYGIPVKGVT